MKLLKFGGTSVGSAKNIKQVCDILYNIDGQFAVVVSAVGGITDKLLKTAELALAGNQAYKAALSDIISVHKEVIYGLFDESNRLEVEEGVDKMHQELTDFIKGVFLISELSKKTQDTIVTFGERVSSFIISKYIDDIVLVDAKSVIKTEMSYGKDIVLFKETNKLIASKYGSEKKNMIIPGFIASNQCGQTTTLGRGGSDYTASIFASALDAEILEIWTDVDGFMTADPRVISKAYVIESLSYAEAMELSHFGAKVIYPPTIFPVLQKSIPIRIKNTLNPEATGTLISDKPLSGKRQMIKGISSINNTCLITMSGVGMVGVIGINHRLFSALADANISVFLVSQASSENSTSFAVVNEDAEKADEALRNEFSKEIEHGDIAEIKIEKELATVAVVGEKMKHTTGIAGKLFNVLGRSGINVIACAQGASERNISFVIKLSSLRKASNVIHESFFLSEYTELNLFLVGVGTVGDSLIQQVQKQVNRLMKEHHLRIKLTGVANSRKFVLNRDGINIEDYKNLLASSEHVNTLENFKQEIIDMNMYNSVFVDCTANANVAELYKDLLSHNIHVVTANKVAASGPLEIYKDLKQTAQKKGIKYLFETNVGAGLPIINTMNALIKSGDKIEKLQAVLSGTLNYLFNTLSADIPLSRAIEMAKEAGYSEPDPRIDLSGIDVIRKLVILARESGYEIEQSDVEMKPFIPQKYFEGTIEDFENGMKELDGEFEKNRQKLEAEGKKLRYVATFDKGQGSVELVPVDSQHPFYDLEGSNNIILLTTERYSEFPMMIKGYGAGADVTAAGVFADIISIANP